MKIYNPHIAQASDYNLTVGIEYLGLGDLSVIIDGIKNSNCKIEVVSR